MSLCKPGGGNDYVCCILCGVEYNPMKGETEPDCRGRLVLRQLQDRELQTRYEMDAIYAALAINKR